MAIGITRQKTTLLLDYVEDGMLDAYEVLRLCLNYMSEDEVCEFIRFNLRDELELDEEL